jgi:hypothetical protein
MLRSINAHSVFSGLQCRKLASSSGGIPRAFVYSCSACITFAIDAGDTHVRDSYILMVERDLADLWRGRLVDSDYEALLGVLDTGGSNIPKAIQLLRDGLLIRDGSATGSAQYRPASWLVPLLDLYRKRRSAAMRSAEKR